MFRGFDILFRTVLNIVENLSQYRYKNIFNPQKYYRMFGVLVLINKDSCFGFISIEKKADQRKNLSNL